MRPNLYFQFEADLSKIFRSKHPAVSAQSVSTKCCKDLLNRNSGSALLLSVTSSISDSLVALLHDHITAPQFPHREKENGLPNCLCWEGMVTPQMLYEHHKLKSRSTEQKFAHEVIVWALFVVNEEKKETAGDDLCHPKIVTLTRANESHIGSGCLAAMTIKGVKEIISQVNVNTTNT